MIASSLTAFRIYYLVFVSVHEANLVTNSFLNVFHISWQDYINIMNTNPVILLAPCNNNYGAGITNQQKRKHGLYNIVYILIE